MDTLNLVGEYSRQDRRMRCLGLRGKLIRIFHKTATGSRSVRLLLTPLGIAFFLSLLVVFVIFSLWIDRFLGIPKFLPASWSLIVSLPILAAGLLLILWSVLCFAKVKGTPVPFNPPPSLVTSGPYAYVRNPMLTGVFALLLGLGLLFRSISLVFFLTPLFALLNIVELKTIEEPELQRRLGDEYLQYRKRVPMFIPRLVRTKR